MSLRRDAIDTVVIVAAKNALPEYLKCSAYICQPNRHFQDYVRLAFYTNNKIYRKVPKILGQVEAISKDEIETRMDLSDVDRARLRDILRMLDTARREVWRQQLKIVFLSAPDSSETLVLPQDIENDLTASTGRGVAFTQGQRYVSLSRLEMGPKTTSELVGD